LIGFIQGMLLSQLYI